MGLRTFLTPSRGPSSLRGALGGGGALLSGLRSPPPRLPPPRYRERVSLGEVKWIEGTIGALAYRALRDDLVQAAIHGVGDPDSW
jgi:hypothetical protein